MKLRKKEPWKSAIDYSKELNGLMINLLVNDIANASEFVSKVIGASIIYKDIDFLAAEGFGCKWCYHADHTYDKHPFYLNSNQNNLIRGLGLEIRLIGCDPDIAEKNAKRHDFVILSESQNKPHGFRESYIKDHDGYCWVPSIKI